MALGMRCRGITAKGEACRAPAAMVDPTTRFCRSHAPGASERLREQGKRGGEATRRRFRGSGLPSEELGDLDTVEDAQRWLRLTAQAVGERRLTHSEGASMVRAVEAWMKCEDVRLRAQDLRDVQAQIEQLKGKAKMEVVR